ncbi:MAG: UDP-N-acetylmuramate dehydrogenase [Defluviitaleaceae bacterium]|nr:UDP-N-acetylmuramate dehydrogenase [Defluviitaleaceae bacterium]
MTFIKALRTILPKEAILTNEPMAKHTTLKIGGPADILVKPNTSEQLRNVYKLCEDNNWPMVLLGSGSNVLIADEGIRGLVMLTTGLDEIHVDTPLNKKFGYITAGAGTKLSKLAEAACKAGLSGLEFIHAIPGSVGGAVYMNAGAYEQFISGVCVCVTLLVNDKLVDVPVNEMGFDYRTSRLQQGEGIVIKATFRLPYGNTEEIRTKMNELNQLRKSKHPQEPSAGSTFKNPKGYAAWELIKNAGMSGYIVGGAKMSDKHSNFAVNINNASADDMCRLLDAVRNKVHEISNVWLEPEIKIIGRNYPWM